MKKILKSNVKEILKEVVAEDKEEKNILFVAIYDKSEYDTVDLDIIKEIIAFFRDTEE